MAKLTGAKSALPYIQRIAEDEYVQEQLRSAVSGARAAYQRARKQRTQVVEDKGLYRNLRQAATSLQKAAGAIRPAPPKPRHRGRKIAVVAVAVGATVLLTMKLQRQQSRRGVGEGVPAGADETRTRDRSQDAEPAVSA